MTTVCKTEPFIAVENQIAGISANLLKIILSAYDLPKTDEQELTPLWFQHSVIDVQKSLLPLVSTLRRWEKEYEKEKPRE